MTNPRRLKKADDETTLPDSESVKFGSTKATFWKSEVISDESMDFCFIGKLSRQKLNVVLRTTSVAIWNIKIVWRVFLNDNNFIFNKTEPGKTEFYWDFNNSFHFNYLFRLIFLTYYLNEGPNFNPFLRPLSGFIFTSNNPFSFVRRLTSFTFANVEFKLIQTSNFNLLRRQIIS